MTTPTQLFALAAYAISPAVFAATRDRASRLAFIRAFNNASDVTVTCLGGREAFAFRGTSATAIGVARAGFRVYIVSAGNYVAQRSMTVKIAEVA